MSPLATMSTSISTDSQQISSSEAETGLPSLASNLASESSSAMMPLIHFPSESTPKEPITALLNPAANSEGRVDWIVKQLAKQMSDSYYSHLLSPNLLLPNYLDDAKGFQWDIPKINVTFPSVDSDCMVIVRQVPVFSDNHFHRGYYQPVGSTADIRPSPHLEEHILYSFTRIVSLNDELYLDGFESRLSRSIETAVGTYGETAVSAIKRLIEFSRLDADTTGEILRQLGCIEDQVTHQSRLAILVDNLYSLDPRIRDAASLGLAALDDPEAIESVNEAIAMETSSQLKPNLELLVEQLQATQWQD